LWNPHPAYIGEAPQHQRLDPEKQGFSESSMSTEPN